MKLLVLLLCCLAHREVRTHSHHTVVDYDRLNSHKTHLRHHHLRYNEHHTIFGSNVSLNLKHGHHFYGRHKRKYMEEHEPEQIHWPTRLESVMEGDVILGGLMMVHEREDNATCGPIMPQGGIQALEAMLFTLDRINEMKLLGPEVKIGAHILDDCDKDTYGLEMAVDFIKGECCYVWLRCGGK
jgi:hypothetical protein